MASASAGASVSTCSTSTLPATSCSVTVQRAHGTADALHGGGRLRRVSAADERRDERFAVDTNHHAPMLTAQPRTPTTTSAARLTRER